MSAHTKSSFDATLSTFLSHLLDEGLSAVTLKGYRADLAHLRTWFESKTGRALQIRQLSLEEVKQYRLQMQRDEGKKAATINRRVFAIRRLVGWAAKTSELSENFCSDILSVHRLKRARPEGLDRTEVNRVLRLSANSLRGQGKRNHALIRVFLGTGVLLNEAAALRVSDVELRAKSGCIRIRQNGTRAKRTVPLDAFVRAALRDYLDTLKRGRADALLFASQRDPRLGVRGIQKIIFKVAKHAGLPIGRVTPLRLRHTFALGYLRDHPDGLESLAKILGHSSIQSTAVYLPPHPDRRKRKKNAKL